MVAVSVSANMALRAGNDATSRAVRVRSANSLLYRGFDASPTLDEICADQIAYESLSLKIHVRQHRDNQHDQHGASGD